MKKFLLALMTVFLVSCQTPGIGELKITDQVYFEPLKESDFVINDYLFENESALDFMKESDDYYRLSIILNTVSVTRNKELVWVTVVNDELNKVVDKYVYPYTDGLLFSNVRSDKLTGAISSYIYNYILKLDETQKEEVITQLKEAPILIKLVGEESGLKEITYSLTNFDN